MTMWQVNRSRIMGAFLCGLLTLLFIDFGNVANAATYCFCDVNGCSTGTGVQVSRSQCDYINGKAANGKVSPEDRDNHRNKYGNTDARNPDWVSGDDIYDEETNRLKNELEEGGKKMDELNDIINKIYDVAEQEAARNFDEEIEHNREAKQYWENEIQERQEMLDDRIEKDKNFKEKQAKAVTDEEKKQVSLMKDNYEELTDDDKKYYSNRVNEAKNAVKETDDKQKKLNTMSDAEKKEMNESNKRHDEIIKKLEPLNEKKNALGHKNLDLMNKINKREGKHQIKISSAPDAYRYLSLNNMRAYVSASGSRYDDDRSASGGTSGDAGNLSVGVDVRLAKHFSLAPSLSFGRSDSDDDGGGGSKTKNLSGSLGFFWGAFQTDDIWLDGSISLTRGSVDTQAVGDVGQNLSILSYDTQNFGMDLGLSCLTHLSNGLQLVGRFGWYGSWSGRDEYTDTASVLNPKTSNQFHRLSTSGRVTYPTDWGQVSGSAALRFITMDNSSASLASEPWDADIGVGVLYNITDCLSLSCNVSSIIGRTNYKEYNSSVKLQVGF
jgi:hypothetical protein